MDLVAHLKSRHLDLELHRPILDTDRGAATFLLWNLSGQMVGFQQYRPNAPKNKLNSPRDSKYFNYRMSSTVAVWGTESLHLTPDLVFVTEGVFDAARLTARGVSAVAVLGNNPGQDVRNWLFSLARRVVVVADNDAAGRQLVKFGHVAVFTEDKDLGDSSQEFVDSLISKFAK